MSKETINGQDRAKARQSEHTRPGGQPSERPRHPATEEERARPVRDPHTGEAGRNPQEIERGPRRGNAPPA